MTALEAHQWAVEQAIASFGTEGCAADWVLERRIKMFLDLLHPPTPSKRERAEGELVA